MQVARTFGGLGLGLAICKALVEAHGGRISAHSAGVNQGAIFEVVVDSQLPPAATPAASVARPAAAASAGETAGVRRLVLLVENHADSARVLVMLLRRRGYDVIHAETVAEARAAFAARTVDVIISNLGLPDGNGADLIRDLLAVRPVSSIVLSGYGEADTLAGSLQAGAHEHLVQPVAWPQLQAALERLLAPPAI